MRFDKVHPKNGEWPAQKVYHRIALISKDIANYNREMNRLDSQKASIEDAKKHVKQKVARKWKYFRQLKLQLKETLQKQLV